jgi:hypothetical protein
MVSSSGIGSQLGGGPIPCAMFRTRQAITRVIHLALDAKKLPDLDLRSCAGAARPTRSGVPYNLSRIRAAEKRRAEKPRSHIGR